MAIVLHYAPHTRAGRVRWLLEELGLTYELRRIDFAGGAHKAEAYRAVHPLNRVPALELDGAVTMIESGAMLVYLADRHPERGLAPAVDAPARAAYLQWMFYTPTQLEPPLLDASWNQVDDARRAAGRAGWHEAATVVERALGDGRPHLCGDAFTAADVMVGSVLGWARAGGLLDAHPTLLAYGRRIAARPAAKAARAD